VFYNNTERKIVGKFFPLLVSILIMEQKETYEKINSLTMWGGGVEEAQI
jgi:hypothetical protein